MSVKTEGRHAGEFLMSEAAGNRSRDTITIPSGTGVIEPGTVLGLVTDEGVVTTSQAADATNAAGTGTIAEGDPAVGADVKVGTYRIVCIEPAADEGQFAVEDPNGVNIGVATVGVEFDGEIVFTISDGATDFVAGEAFSFVVARSSFGYVPSPNAADDGSDQAVAIALYGCDATSAAKKIAAITGDAEVNGNILVYEATVNDAAKKAAKATQLAAVGIKVR